MTDKPVTDKPVTDKPVTDKPDPTRRAAQPKSDNLPGVAGEWVQRYVRIRQQPVIVDGRSVYDDNGNPIDPSTLETVWLLDIADPDGDSVFVGVVDSDRRTALRLPEPSFIQHVMFPLSVEEVEQVTAGLLPETIRRAVERQTVERQAEQTRAETRVGPTPPTSPTPITVL